MSVLLLASLNLPTLIYKLRVSIKCQDNSTSHPGEELVHLPSAGCKDSKTY
ncbi:hypothetical protein M758_9G018900 [Ceratodon purpureus]|nr:hypothetical protein M758_9G018900 [Ceratodon purpureus]